MFKDRVVLDARQSRKRERPRVVSRIIFQSNDVAAMTREIDEIGVNTRYAVSISCEIMSRFLGTMFYSRRLVGRMKQWASLISSK